LVSAVASSVLAAALASGCLSTAARYRVLDFFFDGVPAPYATSVPSSPAEEQAIAEQAAPLADQPLAVESPAPQFSAHPPYAEKECSKCHDEAKSNELVAQGVDLCWNCHEQDNFVNKVVHGPVDSGYCLGCHDPHRSASPKLLLHADSELCGQCHDQRTFPQGELHRASEGDDCVGCHNPHSAGRAYMLRPKTAQQVER
jgi:predicted CXXCH cytochrome family protein